MVTILSWISTSIMPDIKKIIAMAAIAALFCSVGSASCFVGIGLPILIIYYFDISSWWLAIPVILGSLGFDWVVVRTGVIDLLYWTPRRLIREWAGMESDGY